MFLVLLGMDGASLAAPCAEPAVALAPGSAWPRLPARLPGLPRQRSLSLLKLCLPGPADLHQSSLPLSPAYHQERSVCWRLAMVLSTRTQDLEVGTRQGPDHPTELRRHVHGRTGERTLPTTGGPLSLLVRWKEDDRMSPWSCLLS